MKIQLCLALRAKQIAKDFIVNDGLTLGQFLTQTDLKTWIVEQDPSLRFDTLSFGVFSELKPMDYRLQSEDRIEIYRPLEIDPMKKRIERQRNNPVGRMPHLAKKRGAI